MRPANIITAVADVLAGASIAGIFFVTIFPAIDSLKPVVYLILSTIGLYGGGVVFNDVFDAELDAIERPERAIPSGLITKREGTIFGIFLLIPGIFFALMIHPTAGLLAIFITFFALVYDKWGKRHSFLGPLNMGLCRGLNLLLGISLNLPSLSHLWWLAFVPIVYIAAITMTSRGEVHGGKPIVLYATSLLYGLVILSIGTISFCNGHLLITISFLLLFIGLIFPPLLKAIKDPIGKNIGKAVKAAVISLIVMNASWAAAYGYFSLALMILLLLPLSLLLARIFAVT